MKQAVPRRVAAAGFLLVAAAGAVYAELQNGRYASGNPGSIEQAAPDKLASDAKFTVGDYPSYAPALPAGAGQQETTSFCSQCHSTRYITMQPPLPAATWEAEVNKMIRTYGATIPDPAAKKIVSYLQQNFTPETRKQ